MPPLKSFFIPTNLLLALCASVQHSSADLVSGPMLGHLEMREAIVWAQSDQAADLSVVYHAEGDSQRHTSQAVYAEADTAYSAKLVLDRIEPGTTYRYQVLENGVAVGEQYSFTSPDNYRDRSPAPDFKFAVGGAHYVIEDGYEPPISSSAEATVSFKASPKPTRSS